MRPLHWPRFTLGLVLSWMAAPGLHGQPSAPNPLARLTLNERQPRIHLPVKVNGDGPHSFLLDTGYSISMLNPELAEALALESRGSVTIIGIAGREEAKVYRGITFSLGEADYRPRRAAALPSQRDRRGRMGILGSDFCRRFVVEIRRGEREVCLYDPEQYRYAGAGQVVPLEFDGGTPIVRAGLSAPGHDPARVRLEIDTGCDGSLCVASALLEEHPWLAQTEELGRSVRTGVGGDARTVIRTIPNLTLGDVKVPGLRANVFEQGSPVGEGLAGHLGIQMLGAYTVILDYSRSRMILETPAAPAQPLTPEGSPAP